MMKQKGATSAKKKSGAANRAARADRQEAERRADLERRRAAGERVLDFADLPPPPLDDTAAAILWWNQVLLTCTAMVIRDVVLTFPEKLRYLSDFSAKGGFLRDKSAEQQAIKRALAVHRNHEKEAPMGDFKPIPPRFLDGKIEKPVYYGDPRWRQASPLPNEHGLTPAPRFVFEGGKAFAVYPGEPEYATASTELPKVKRPEP